MHYVIRLKGSASPRYLSMIRGLVASVANATQFTELGEVAKALRTAPLTDPSYTYELVRLDWENQPERSVVLAPSEALPEGASLLWAVRVIGKPCDTWVRRSSGVLVTVDELSKADLYMDQQYVTQTQREWCSAHMNTVALLDRVAYWSSRTRPIEVVVL